MKGGEDIDPTAIVETGSFVGAGTRIWHHAHVRADATVGRDCVIGKNVFVDAQVSVGDRCKIQNNASVYRGVTLENDVFVGPSVTFTNDRVPRAFSADWVLVETLVCRGASIGAGATIVCGVEIGEYSMIAAGAVVVADVAPQELVAGTPAKHLGWVCRCGETVSRSVERPADLVCGECANGLTE